MQIGKTTLGLFANLIVFLALFLFHVSNIVSQDILIASVIVTVVYALLLLIAFRKEVDA